MRIAMVDYVCDPKKPGEIGLSDVVWNLASNFASLGDDIHIVAPYQTSKFPDDKITVHRFDLPPIGYRNIIGHALIVLRAVSVLKKIRNIDLIFLPEYFSSAIIGLLIKNIPIVVMVPGNIYERIAHGNPYDWITTQAFKLAAKITIRHAYIIAISQDMRKWWEYTGADPSKIKVIPNGTDLKFFKHQSDARRYLKIPKDITLVLYAGRLSNEKGLKDLFEAIANLKKEIKNLQLYIVGSGPQEKELKKFADELGIKRIVIFKGWIPKEEMPYYYSAADVFVLPSYSEGMPRVMIEAMACKTVFIGTTISGVIDHITDMKNGMMVKPGKIEDLASKMYLVLTDHELKDRIASNGYEYVCKNLSWGEVSKKIKSDVFIRITSNRERYL